MDSTLFGPCILVASWVSVDVTRIDRDLDRDGGFAASLIPMLCEPYSWFWPLHWLYWGSSAFGDAFIHV